MLIIKRAKNAKENSISKQIYKYLFDLDQKNIETSFEQILNELKKIRLSFNKINNINIKNNLNYYINIYKKDKANILLKYNIK